MKKANATAEIIMLERLTGGDPKKALRNRRVRRAIQTIRNAWSEEPMRYKGDVDEILLNTIKWNWPLRRYTSEERQAREEKLRAELERNRPVLIYADPETLIGKLRYLFLSFRAKSRNLVRRKTYETS